MFVTCVIVTANTLTVVVWRWGGRIILNNVRI